MYLTATAEETFAQAFIREVNNDLNDVKHSFIRIGFRLREANEFQYYKELGYQNITELAEAEFGFKKTTTYELMSVHELAHDPDCRWSIADTYDKYSYSQLLALTYLKYSTRNAMFIVQPTDSVRKIKRFVSVWNREAKLYSCYDAYPIKSVDEYLKAYDKEQDQEQEQTSASEYVGQLPGQIALSLQEPVEYEEESDEPDEEFSERSEKFEEVADVPEETFEPMTDSELIKYCLKLGTFIEEGKFRIMRCHSELTRAAFVKYVKNEYGIAGRTVHGEPYSSIDCNSNDYTIYRTNGGKIVLTWSVVAGYISRMIEADEYLTDKEKEEFERWQTAYNGFAVSLPAQEEPERNSSVEVLGQEAASSFEVNFSERSEKLEKEEVQQTPKREYLLTVKKETVGRLMVAFVSDNYDMESEKVCKIEEELHRQLNGKFSSYHFSDLAEFITESDVSAEKYTEVYCSILALLGVEVTE